MAIAITPTGGFIGAEVSGVDLSRPLDADSLAAIRQAWLDHQVLFFRDQDITIDQQMDFARNFGSLSVHPFSPNMDDKPEVIVLDYHKDNPPDLTDVWHSDETFRESPPMGTVLRAKTVPTIGGDTLWASMTAAYEDLSDRLKHYIHDLRAVHDFKPFRTLFTDSPEHRAKMRALEDRYPNPVHPVVREHPETGKPILYVNPQFTLRIVGMKDSESRSLLELLFRQTQIPEFQARLKWRPDTIAFWDNRATQHYAVLDYYPQRRQMERVTIAGDKPFGLTKMPAAARRTATGKLISPLNLRADEGEIATREHARGGRAVPEQVE